MGSSDLKFRWHSESFVLRDIEIFCSIKLQQLDENGDWCDREPWLFIGIFDEEKEKEISEYENLENIKYSKSTRTLTAKAGFIGDSYNEMYLGVPEDKQSTHNRESRIEYFDLSIHETEIDDLEKTVRSGMFGYMEGGGPFAEFYVPTHVFDDIERLSAQPDIDFHISINRKGWQWTGHHGDGQIYLDTENYEMAEFAGITISKKFKEFETDTLQEVEDYSQNAIETNMHIFIKLSELGRYMTSINFATWIAALGIIYLAFSSYQ